MKGHLRSTCCTGRVNQKGHVGCLQRAAQRTGPHWNKQGLKGITHRLLQPEHFLFPESGLLSISPKPSCMLGLGTTIPTRIAAWASAVFRAKRTRAAPAITRGLSQLQARRRTRRSGRVTAVCALAKGISKPSKPWRTESFSIHRSSLRPTRYISSFSNTRHDVNPTRSSARC